MPFGNNAAANAANAALTFFLGVASRGSRGPPSNGAGAPVVFPFSSSPGRAAKRAEGDKEAAYPVRAAEAQVQAVDFSPCVAEAFGRFGPRSADLIRKLAGRNAADWGLTPGVEVRRWFSLLSRRLLIDQADILLNSCR